MPGDIILQLMFDGMAGIVDLFCYVSLQLDSNYNISSKYHFRSNPYIFVFIKTVNPIIISRTPV